MLKNKFESLGGIQPVQGGNLFTPMSNNEIVFIETTLDTSFPATYKWLLKTYGAIRFRYLTTFNPIIPLPKHISSSGKGNFDYFLGVKQLDKGSVAYALLWAMDMYKDRMPETVIPIGAELGGSMICMGISGHELGKIFYWDHTNEWDEDDYNEKGLIPQNIKFKNLHIIANTFDKFIFSLQVSEFN